MTEPCVSAPKAAAVKTQTCVRMNAAPHSPQTRSLSDKQDRLTESGRVADDLSSTAE